MTELNNDKLRLVKIWMCDIFETVLSSKIIIGLSIHKTHRLKMLIFKKWRNGLSVFASELFNCYCIRAVVNIQSTIKSNQQRIVYHSQQDTDYRSSRETTRCKQSC